MLLTQIADFQPPDIDSEALHPPIHKQDGFQHVLGYIVNKYQSKYSLMKSSQDVKCVVVGGIT